jgi:hypothetical protein
MAGSNTTNQLQRNYLSKDFEDLRADLLRYSATFFPDKIKDFSEASLGGMLLDIAASVGDTMSYYLDHQFNELSWSDAVELVNIERHLRDAGVKITGASPATVDLTFFIEVPAVLTTSGYEPQTSALPIILAGTVANSVGRIPFTLVDDINFNDRDRSGFLKSTVTVGEVDTNGNPTTYILSRKGTAVSATRVTETFSVPNGYNPFFTITLSNTSTSRIVNVVDTEGNIYYEVDSLTQDTVYRQVQNYSYDSQSVGQNLEIIPAPRRFTVSTSLSTRLSTLTFGGGDNSADEKTVLDPSALALPLYGMETVPRYSLDPNSLLRSKTLGVAPSNTTLTVTYEHGGGISHNVASESIRSIVSLSMIFPGIPSSSIASSVRASVDVLNVDSASGGANQPTVQDLRLQIPAAKNSQLRVVTKEDLIARVYSLPTKFGKISKVGSRSNPSNPMAKQLYVLSYDTNNHLTRASDTLKLNIQNYLNDLRLISDAIDIVDSPVVNYSIKCSVIISPNYISLEVLQNVFAAISAEVNTVNFQIDQPLVIADLTNAIINVPGVLSLVTLEISNLSGEIDDREYSSYSYDIEAATNRGIIVAPPGGIFEMKYPSTDIVVVSV